MLPFHGNALDVLFPGKGLRALSGCWEFRRPGEVQQDFVVTEALPWMDTAGREAKAGGPRAEEAWGELR